MMQPWEIWLCEFTREGAHPCVLFTHGRVLNNPDLDRVNVLFCRTLRGPRRRELRAGEILLDRADGLDWETLCHCDVIHYVAKNTLLERRGLVCYERQRQISQAILRFFPFIW